MSIPVLNLGVLAHVDAGKTSLTERLLYRAGVVPELGSVDRGTTTTDSLALERRRGITIRTAVASFVLDTPDGPRLVDLVDTPAIPTSWPRSSVPSPCWTAWCWSGPPSRACRTAPAC